MKELLPNCLYEAGAKLTIGGRTKHRIIPPNSTCFMSRFSSVYNRAPNLVTLELIIIKNGKRGKNRVDRVGVATTVFPIEFEKRPLKSNKYQHIPVVQIKKVPFDVSDVKAISPIDFVGWAYAYKMYMRDVYAHANIVDKWPAGKGQYVNLFGNISARMQKHAEATINALSDPIFRQAFTQQIRAMEAGTIQCVLEEKIKRAQIRAKSLAYLIWSEKHSKKDLYDLDILGENYSYCRSLIEAEQNLHYQMRINRWSSLPAKRKKTSPKPVKWFSSSTLSTLLEKIDLYIQAKERPSFNAIVTPNQPQVGDAWFLPHKEVFSIEEV